MKKRRSNKPAAVQVAVAARRLAGQSKSRIAKDLAISRNTVAVILSEAELSSFIERSKKIIFEALEEIASLRQGREAGLRARQGRLRARDIPETRCRRQRKRKRIHRDWKSPAA